MASGVAQLGERSHTTPEVRGSNPDIGKFYIYCQRYKKDKKRICREWPNFY